MTITDFLLARIADDTALARSLQAQAVTDHIDPEDPRLPHLTLAARVLAECEAKRRIVSLYDESTAAHEAIARLPIIRLLALPYANHPDYDPVWRV